MAPIRAFRRPAAAGRAPLPAAALQWLIRASLLVLALLCYVLISTVGDGPSVTAPALLLRDASLRRHQHKPMTNGTAAGAPRPPSQIARNEKGDTNPITDEAAVETIGFAVTITDCGDEFPIEDAAMVLQYSLDKVSVRSTGAGRYDYQLYAIYHPDAAACASPLADLGYVLLRRDTPVNVSAIRGDHLRERIEHNGCCGARELIKLEAFTLERHRVVVLLDLDVLVLRPLDGLFDLMLRGRRLPVEHYQANASSPLRAEDIQLLHTFDYNMVNPERTVMPVQGGFVLLKPNLTIYREMVDIVLQGDYNTRGWGGKTGKFWGSMTWQGVLPYYYYVLHKGHAIELNRCLYDNMVQDPRYSEIRKRRNETERKCFTATCEDCRKRPVQDIYSAHFTSCLKPWTCPRFFAHRESAALCHELHHAWFRLRSEMEAAWGRVFLSSHNSKESDHHYGFCRGNGIQNYIKVQNPFEKPIEAA